MPDDKDDKKRPFNVKYRPRRRYPSDLNDPVPLGGDYQEDPATMTLDQARFDRRFAESAYRDPERDLEQEFGSDVERPRQGVPRRLETPVANRKGSRRRGWMRPKKKER